MRDIAQEIVHEIVKWKLPKLFIGYRFYEDGTWSFKVWASVKEFRENQSSQFFVDQYGNLGQQIQKRLTDLGEQLVRKLGFRPYDSVGWLECSRLTKGLKLKYHNEETQVVWNAPHERKIPDILSRMLQKEMEALGGLDFCAETTIVNGITEPFDTFQMVCGEGLQKVGRTSPEYGTIQYILNELVDDYPFHQFFKKNGDEETEADKVFHLKVVAQCIGKTFFSGMLISDYQRVSVSSSETLIIPVKLEPRAEVAPKILLWA